MKKVLYNKLIRDKIPAKMEKRGVRYHCYTLNKKDFEKALIKKVGEEAGGLLAARTPQEFLEELADVVDVLDELRRVKKISPKKLKNQQRKNNTTKGAFKKRLFLVWSGDSDGYKTNEKKYKR